MDTIEHLVEVLEAKVKLTLKKVKLLQDENEALKTELISCNQKISKQHSDLSSIEEQYNSLKMANTLSGSNENAREAKVKINALIKDIDLCISQLSD